MDGSIARGLLESYNVINTVLESKSVNAELHNLNKVRSAFQLGEVKGNQELCNDVFHCETELDLPLPAELESRTKTVDCGGLNLVCPGVS